MATPDWVQIGAEVAEQKNGKYTYTTVKNVTATLIVLMNGSKYRIGDMTKVGEQKRYVGANGPSRLMSVQMARQERSRHAVQVARAKMAQISGYHVIDMEPAALLDGMQTIIDEARRKLAEINR